MGEEKSRVLVIGGSGYVGKYVAKASFRLGHPTFVLLRPSTLSTKPNLIHEFQSDRISILMGSLDEYESLAEAVKKVDVVISAVSGPQHLPQLPFLAQLNLIRAIKEVGTIKRFYPSEFGMDIDHGVCLESTKLYFDPKVKIRRAIEEAKIPYTYVSSNCFADIFARNLVQQDFTLPPPTDKVLIHGDGNVKGIFVKEEDAATYTIKSIDDPRTLNKILYIRPPANILSLHELVAIWEKKIGKTLEKHYMSEEEIIKKVQETPYPNNLHLGVIHSIFVNSNQYGFDVSPQGVEASELYPEVKYTTMDEYFDKFV